MRESVGQVAATVVQNRVLVRVAAVAGTEVQAVVVSFRWAARVVVAPPTSTRRM